MRKLSRLSVIALALFGAMAPLSASANHESARITAVRDCGLSSQCSSPRLISEGEIVDDFIQIEASAGHNDLYGFTWLQVHIRHAGDTEWRCVRQWSLGGAKAPFPRDFPWGTQSWPGSVSCSDVDPPEEGAADPQPNVRQSSSGPTPNGTFEIRARVKVASLGSGSISAPSSSFVIKVNNRPSRPKFVGEPRDIGPSKKPIVELKWRGSPEPDMVQYDVIRDGPDGRVFYNLQAGNPGGCSRSSDNYYTCNDTNFPESGSGGSYSYSVIGYRSSPSNPSSAVSCEYGGSSCICKYGGSCIASDASVPASVSINEPSPSPSPSTGGSPSTSPSKSPTGSSPSSSPSTRNSPNNRGGSSVLSGRTDPSEFFTGTYDEQLPYEQRGGFGSLLPGDGTGDGSAESGSGFEGFERGGEDELASPGGFGGDEELLRQLLVSIAAGLLVLLIAGHLARLLTER